MKAIDHSNAHEPHQPPGLNESRDELVQRCWPLQECWDCLRHDPCSWCPSVRRIALLSFTRTLANPIIVRDLRSQHRQISTPSSHLQSRCMLTLVGTLGSTNHPFGLPCIHDHPPNLHHIRIINIRGHRTSCRRRESNALVYASLESQTAWLVEGVEILSSRLVERLET
jgi:hypothetical protein